MRADVRRLAIDSFERPIRNSPHESSPLGVLQIRLGDPPLPAGRHRAGRRRHGERDPLHLIVEIKGYRREDATEKKATIDERARELAQHGEGAGAAPAPRTRTRTPPPARRPQFPLDTFLCVRWSAVADEMWLPRQRNAEPGHGPFSSDPAQSSDRHPIAPRRSAQGPSKPGYRVAPPEGGLAHGHHRGARHSGPGSIYGGSAHFSGSRRRGGAPRR